MTTSTPVIELAEPNNVFIIPRLDEEGEIFEKKTFGIGSQNVIAYKDVILGGWDAIENFYLAEVGRLDENEKVIDDKIKNTKQNLSTHIIKQQEESNIFSSFVFLHSLVWQIDKENDNDFIHMKITGHPDVSVMSDIHIPKKYLKTNVTPKSFIDKLRRDYVTQRENIPLDDYFDSL